MQTQYVFVRTIFYCNYDLQSPLLQLKPFHLSIKQICDLIVMICRHVCLLNAHLNHAVFDMFVRIYSHNHTDNEYTYTYRGFLLSGKVFFFTLRSRPNTQVW